MSEELFSDDDLKGMQGSFFVAKTDPIPSFREPSPADRSRFINDVIRPGDGEKSGVNGLTFDKLSKLYGTAYLQCVYDAYSCNGGCMTDEEFCQYWGNIPKGFFDKKIKHQTWFRKL
jgi:hypothetical protein